MPYLQQPYDRIKASVRSCADGILWCKNAGQGDIFHYLKGTLPFVLRAPSSIICALQYMPLS